MFPTIVGPVWMPTRILTGGISQLPPMLIVADDRRRDRARSPAGPGRMIRLQLGRAQKAINELPMNLSMVPCLRVHAGGEEAEMMVEERRRIGCRQSLGEAGEVDDIGEQHRELALFEGRRPFALLAISRLTRFRGT